MLSISSAWLFDLDIGGLGTSLTGTIESNFVTICPKIYFLTLLLFGDIFYVTYFLRDFDLSKRLLFSISITPIFSFSLLLIYYWSTIRVSKDSTCFRSLDFWSFRTGVFIFYRAYMGEFIWNILLTEFMKYSINWIDLRFIRNIELYWWILKNTVEMLELRSEYISKNKLWLSFLFKTGLVFLNLFLQSYLN